MYAGPRIFRQLGAITLATVFLLPAATGQMQVSDNLRMTLNGILGFGYGGQFGNASQFGPGGHNVYLQGEATLAGSYYNPQFLSFNVQPYYNRSQANASLASAFDETGINGTVNLFSGSHFPGSVGFGQVWAEGTQYGLGPGLPSVSANGKTDTFDITWSALFPKLPTLTATWSDTAVSDEIIGDIGTTESAIKSLNLSSGYTFRGFTLFGLYSHQNFNVTFPSFITGPNEHSTSANDNFAISANHSLPLQGSLGINYLHSNYSGEGSGFITDGSSNVVTANAGVSLTQKLTLGGNARYYTNLFGGLQNTLLPPGSIPAVPLAQSSDGVVFNAYSGYTIGRGFGVLGYAGYGVQHYQGGSYNNTQLGATLTYSYSRPLLGMLYLSFGMVNTANAYNYGYGAVPNSDQFLAQGSDGQGGLAAVSSVGLKKQFGAWEVTADASYNQSMQSTAAWYATSNYNFGATVRRQVGEFTYWSATAREARTALAQVAGTDNHGEYFSTAVTRKRISLSANYAQSGGTSILTASGELVPVPLPSGLIPGETLYNGTSYGGTFSVTPIRRMVVNASWFRTNSDNTFVSSTGPEPGLPPSVIFSSNNSNRLNGVMTYRFRKLYFQAQYWRINQEISASGLPRVIQNNYSFTISRWFNVF
jgi:hypothetical protein